MSIISVKNLNVVLNNHHILKDISFDIDKGEIVAIVGPNGSGKTTLLRALLGFLPYRGEIVIAGEPPKSLITISSRIGYVPQHLEFDRTIPVTVEELLAIHQLKKSRGAIAQALAAVGAEKLLGKRLGVLSGGEFQRVLLALALINQPEILFLDEPVAGVDVEGAGEIYELIKSLQKKQALTILLVSHDIDVVFRYAGKVLCINHALICQGVPREALTKETLEGLYGGERALYVHKTHD